MKEQIIHLNQRFFNLFEIYGELSIIKIILLH